jgi:hypothetical protein
MMLSQNQKPGKNNGKGTNVKDILWAVSSLPIGTKIFTRAGVYGVVKKQGEYTTEILKPNGNRFFLLSNTLVYRIGQV